MASLDLQFENTLKQAIAEAKIVQHFQYGHNLLQAPVQVDEVFGMLDSIIKKVIDQIDDVIPDINLAPYADGKVDPSRANLCWVQLKQNYYGLILNTHIGSIYRPFTDEDIQNLLLNGQCASWYLVSKIQNLSYLVATDNGNNSVDGAIKYFKTLIIDIIERFFNDHESSKYYHPAGRVSADNLDKIISRAQIQNSSSIVASTNDKSVNGTSSNSIIKTPTEEICWQSVSNLPLTAITHSNISKMIHSDYLFERSDVEVFLKSTFEKYNGKSGLPNEFCFYANFEFGTPYINLDYIVESQLQGYIEVDFSDGEIRKIFPDAQPIVFLKGKNSIIFIVIIKLDNDITKKVERILMTNNNELEHLKLTISCTGVCKEYDKTED